MKRDHDNPQPVIDALAYAARTQGWNNRRGDVQRFTLPNRAHRRGTCSHHGGVAAWLH